MISVESHDKERKPSCALKCSDKNNPFNCKADVMFSNFLSKDVILSIISLIVCLFRSVLTLDTFMTDRLSSSTCDMSS